MTILCNGYSYFVEIYIYELTIMNAILCLESLLDNSQIN